MHNDQTGRSRHIDPTQEKSRQFIGIWEGSGNCMHHSNISNRNGFMEFRTLAVRSFRSFKGWHKRLLIGQRGWPMICHYAMWLPMAVIIVMLGALDAGRKELIRQQNINRGEAQGIALLIHTATLKQWSDVEI